jgi:polyphenol oxidase
MIQPAPGVAFTLAEDGDMRGDAVARRRVSHDLDIEGDWATVNQVHGGDVVEVETSGCAGEADAMLTRVPGLALAVLTADCLGVVVSGRGGLGVAHAGWRGIVSGVLGNLVARMARVGIEPTIAHVGPAIGPCCFEVGDDVASRFEVDDRATTTWGTRSVDLIGAARRQLHPIPLRDSGRCSRHDPGHHSHRANGTTARMASIGWASQ